MKIRTAEIVFLEVGLPFWLIKDDKTVVSIILSGCNSTLLIIFLIIEISGYQNLNGFPFSPGERKVT